MSRDVLGNRHTLAAGMHIVAGGLGGALAVVTVRTSLRLVGLEPGMGATALVAVLVAVAFLVDTARIGLSVPSTGVQVPPHWRDSLPLAAWVVAFGALLGFSMLTRVSSALVWVGLLAGALLPGVMWLSLVYGATFGVARTAVVLTRRTDTLDIAARGAWKVHALAGLALVVLSTAPAG